MNELSTRYLERLTVALTDAPADLRDEIIAGVAEGLAGLDGEQAAARIAELGDPARIAAEALGDPARIAAEALGDAHTQQSPAPAVPLAPPRRSPVYVAVTVGLLVVGGYLLPVVGWLAAILLIAGSSAWSPREKKVAIATSVGAGIVALVVLFTLRGPQSGGTGLVLFLVIPLVVNLGVGFYLGLKSRTAVAAQRG